MRVQLSTKDSKLLFSSLEVNKIKLSDIARTTQVSLRTVTDWKRGKYTIPSVSFNKIFKLAGSPASITPEYLDNWWNNSISGRKGALARMKKYGSLGTPEGRSLGGLNSYLARRNNTHDIFTTKTILEPAQDEHLAEFVGILIGDGSLTEYQVAIASNTTTDSEYIIFVARLIKRLFGIAPRISIRSDINCTMIVASSIKMVEFLTHIGVLQGNKLAQGLDIPSWIQDDQKYANACIRGIFDTDGSIFQETHVIKGRIYSYPRMSFVSMSENLISTINTVLIDLGFYPKIRKNRVNLESQSDINRYFDIIGTSNPKHFNRFSKFGGVG